MDRICKTSFSSLLKAKGVFLRSARDLVVGIPQKISDCQILKSRWQNDKFDQRQQPFIEYFKWTPGDADVELNCFCRIMVVAANLAYAVDVSYSHSV